MELRDLILLKLIKGGGSSLVEETATGNPVGFDTEVAKPLKSLVVPLTYSQEGTGDPSPTNIRPITGVSSLFCVHAKKNMGYLRGYSAANRGYDMAGTLTNSYGTTISTIDPESSVTITQSSAPKPDSKSHYENGYFSIRTDNMVSGQYYDMSIKVTDITSNPLEATLSNFTITSPNGNLSITNEVIGNVITWHNMLYKDTNGRQAWEVRICGMSCTISEFMVTPANTNDGVYEAYDGAKLDVTFPVNVGTVYGGSLDLISGVLTVDYASYTFTGAESDGLTFIETKTSAGITRHIFNTDILDRYAVTKNADRFKSNIAVRTVDGTASTPLCFYNGTPTYQFGLYIDATLCEATVESINSWLAEHPCQVVFPLATPFTVQLTPAQASAFVGDNTVWTNTTGDLTVKYYDKQ